MSALAATAAASTANGGGAAADKSQLFAFAASGGKLLAETETNDDWAREHPLLAKLRGWLAQSEEVHRLNMQDGTASGLMAHLRDTWGWTTGRNEVGDEFRAALGAPGSNADLGRMVDAEISALLLGVSLQQSPHAYTCMLLEFLRARNWLPLATQVPLWHRSNTIYTFADLLAYDVAAKQLVLIELKTGFDHAYDTPISNLHRPVDVFVDTHRMRHQQQLCWMHVVLEAELAKLAPASAGSQPQQQNGQAAQVPPPLRGCIVRVSASAGVRAPDWSDEAVRQFFAQIYIHDDPVYGDAVRLD